MDLQYGFERPDRYRGGFVSIGNFDGVHRGHQQMAARLVQLARSAGVPSVIFTFDPPPAAILTPERIPPRLTTVGDKAQLLHQAGIDCVIVYPTDRNLLQLNPEEFFKLIIRDELQARGLVEGSNFRFGYKRAGDVTTLLAFCEEAGIELEVIDSISGVNGQPVSSTDIRKAVSDGRMRDAAQMLGRLYTIHGTVATGAQRGRTIGFPTANLENIPVLLPPEGVYSGQVVLADTAYAAAVNIGPNPTFSEQERKVEIHLLQFSGDLYGQELKLEFLDHIREVQKFDSVDALRAQLEQDVNLAEKQFLAWNSRPAGSDSLPLDSGDALANMPPGETPMTIDWRPLIALIHDAQRFVITSHVRPDGDAVGSGLGLCGVLESLGKTVRVINPSATPNHLAFLDPGKKIQKFGEGVTTESVCDTDVHIIVDTSAWQQLDALRKVIEQTPARKVVIDHHVSSDELGAEEFKDVTAAATGVLILELAEALGVTPGIDQATQIFTAVATDTGWYRFPNTDARTLEAARKLVMLGAQPSKIYQELYERSSLARLKLHGRVLSRVSVDFEGRLAHTFVLQQDFDELKAHPWDTEDLVNDCLTIDGAQCAVIFVEQKSGQVKVSFRSRTALDVARIAEQFGGGGHRQASGALLPGPFATARQRVLDTLQKVLALEPPT